MSSLGDGTSHDTNVFTFIVLACAMQAGFGLRLIAATRYVMKLPEFEPARLG